MKTKYTVVQTTKNKQTVQTYHHKTEAIDAMGHLIVAQMAIGKHYAIDIYKISKKGSAKCIGHVDTK